MNALADDSSDSRKKHKETSAWALGIAWLLRVVSPKNGSGLVKRKASFGAALGRIAPYRPIVIILTSAKRLFRKWSSCRLPDKVANPTEQQEGKSGRKQDKRLSQLRMRFTTDPL